MKRSVFLLFVIAHFISLMGVSAQSERRTVYHTVLIESFDGGGVTPYPEGTIGKSLDANGQIIKQDISGQPITWKTGESFASRKIVQGYPQAAYVKNNWPAELFGLNPENPEEKETLGIRSKFKRKGNNYFALYPGTASANQTWEPFAIPLSQIDRKSTIHSITLWVWGAEYDYQLEVYVRDYNSITYAVPMKAPLQKAGSLNFKGWQKMSAFIPAHIPQATFRDKDVRLQLVKFVVRTNPEEYVEDFFVYFDQLEAATSTKPNYYDGKELVSNRKVKDIWGDDPDVILLQPQTNSQQ